MSGIIYIAFFENLGFVTGEYRSLFATVNGGLTWERHITPITVQSVYVSDNFDVYIYGGGGSILRKSFEIDGASATLLEVENQTDGEALLAGLVASNGSAVSGIGFEYGLDHGFEHSVGATPSDMYPGCADSITAEISNLDSNTEYFYRMKWTYNGQEFYSDTLSFRTLTEYEMYIDYTGFTTPHSIEISSRVISREAVVTGIVFEYSPDSSFNQSAPGEPFTVDSETSVYIRYVLEGLEPNTRYLVRMKALYKGEEIYSNIRPFHTNPEFTIQMNSPWIEGNSATLSARVTPFLDIMRNIGFEYGTTLEFGSYQQASPDTVMNDWGNKVQSQITDLDIEQVYYYRLRGEMAGRVVYSHTDILNLPGGIVMVMLEAEQVSDNKLQVKALVNSNQIGLSDVYFEYGTNGEFTDSIRSQPYYLNPYITELIVTEIDRLELNTTYNFRIRARESEKTHYSEAITFTLLDHTGVKKVSHTPEVILYPNPASNTLNLKASDPMEKVHVFDMQGKLLISEEYPVSIDISDLDPGIYLIRIAINDRIVVRRFIKE